MYEVKSWIVHIGLPGGSCRYIPSSPSAAPALAVLANQCVRIPKLLPLPRRRLTVREQRRAQAGCLARGSDDPGIRESIYLGRLLLNNMPAPGVWHAAGIYPGRRSQSIILGQRDAAHQTLPLNIAPITAVARSRPAAGLAPAPHGPRTLAVDLPGAEHTSNCRRRCTSRHHFGMGR